MRGEGERIGLSQERVGTVRLNKYGNMATCIKYNKSNDIIIQFSNLDTQHTSWHNFNKGKFKSPSDPLKDGGIVGIMNVTKDPEIKMIYETWRSMFKRCYSESVHSNRPTYKQVACCKEWYYFPNFLEWIQLQENYQKWKQNYSKWHLDKDILSSKINKTYSSETCTLVPSVVNELFVSCKAARGKYPIGVYFEASSGKFKSQCRNPILNKTINLGRYIDPKEAFEAYKEYKESLIKEIAEQEYKKGNITQECYDALLKYQVEITD